MKKSSAMPWWGWLAWLSAVAAGGIAFHYLPSRVPTHYTLSGQPSRFGVPVSVVMVEPAIMLGVILVWHVLWRIDPKKRNYDTFWSTYRYIGAVLIVFIGLMYLSNLGHVLNIVPVTVLLRFGPTIFGIMILLLANVLPRLQPNWWIGIRTPWTLSSDESWNRTHRLAGHLGIPTGILMAALVWALPNPMIPTGIVIPLILWALITVVASYFYAKSDKQQ